MKFSGKMCLKIILKATKNQGFTLSLEDTFLEKPQEESNWEIVRNSDKEKYVYSGYGITFDSGGSRSFDNVTARNLVLIVVHHYMLTIPKMFF